jgi:hypothetical protein
MNIPEIKIENEQVIKDVLEVPILINGETKKVKMNKISSGKRREIIKKYVKTGVSNQQVNTEVTDPLGIQTSVLSEVIFEAPFKTTEKDLENLPEDVIDYLYSQYENWAKKKPISED